MISRFVCLGYAHKQIMAEPRAHEDNDQALKRLLDSHHVYDSFYDHVSLISPKGKFRLSGVDTYQEFMYHYCRAILGGAELGLAEVPQLYIPVIVDIDLKFPSVVGDRQMESGHHFYSFDFVQSLIRIYQKVLLQYVVFPDETEKETALICAWLDKPPYDVQRGDTLIWKNGFHLHFPNLFLSRVDQETKIIPRVIQELLRTLDSVSFPEEILNKEDFLDKKALGNTWLLYGSVKAEGSDPYRLARMFDARGNEIDTFEALKTVKLLDSSEEPVSVRSEDIGLFLPRIFSIFSYQRPTYETIVEQTFLIEHIHRPNQRRKPPNEGDALSARDRTAIQQETLYAKRLVQLLSPERSTGHDDWMHVGWALFNITDGSQEGLDIWIQFSLQTPEHGAARCIYEWNRMDNRRTITLGTLKYFARMDNPVQYTRLVAEQVTVRKIKTTEYGLAELFYSHCQGEFSYCNRNWYQFRDNYWHKRHEGLAVKRRIIEVLIPLLRHMRQSLSSAQSADDEEEEDKETEKLREQLKTAITSLENSRTIRNIWELSKILFEISDFEDLLDTDRYLIGFANGVYDLKENTFRAGQPSDYITKHMLIDFVPHTPDDSKVKEVYEFFDKVFPVQAVRRYVLDIMSELFVGYNHRKHVYILTGDGDNSKSITQMFFEKMLGPLSMKASTTLLTRPKASAGAAHAELARSKGVRAMWLEEPDADEEIYQGFLKSLSGNDSFFARDLYQAGNDTKEIHPMFKLFFICNGLPRVRHGGDKATWNRLRVIPFISTFTKDAPKTIEEQRLVNRYPIDPALDQKIPGLVEALAWILIEHRKLPKAEEPLEVRAATEEYRTSNDTIAYFMRQHMEEIPKEEGEVTVNWLFECYKGFCNNASARFAHLPLMDFDKVIRKRMGAQDGHNYWRGWKCYTWEQLQLRGEDDASAATVMENISDLYD